MHTNIEDVVLSYVNETSVGVADNLSSNWVEIAPVDAVNFGIIISYPVVDGPVSD